MALEVAEVHMDNHEEKVLGQAKGAVMVHMEIILHLQQLATHHMILIMAMVLHMVQHMTCMPVIPQLIPITLHLQLHHMEDHQ